MIVRQTQIFFFILALFFFTYSQFCQWRKSYQVTFLHISFLNLFFPFLRISLCFPVWCLTSKSHNHSASVSRVAKILNNSHHILQRIAFYFLSIVFKVLHNLIAFKSMTFSNHLCKTCFYLSGLSMPLSCCIFLHPSIHTYPYCAFYIFAVYRSIVPTAFYVSF